MSIKLKLLLWYTATFALSGIVLVTALYLLVTNKMKGDADTELREEYVEWAQITLSHIDDLESVRLEIEREMELPEIFSPLTYRLRDVLSNRDVIFVASDKLRVDLDRLVPLAAVLDGPVWSAARIGQGDKPFRFLSGPLDAKGRPGLALQVGMHIGKLEDRLDSIRFYLLVMLSGVIVIAGLGGWLLAGRSLRPFDDVIADLERVESQTLEHRLRVGSAKDEVNRLREAINRMLGRLQTAFDGAQYFTAAAAHELRTPIAALRCRLELALNRPNEREDTVEMLSDAFSHVTRLGKLIESLLLLARMDAQAVPAQADTIDVKRLIDDVGEPFAASGDQRGVSLRWQAGAGLYVKGDAVLLRRLLGNILDNAVTHTPAGGAITVRAEGVDSECRIAVTDTGSGIPPGDLAKVFDRFYRADEARSRQTGGTGLGLSIVKRIAELHRGRVAITSEPGRGTTVTVALPLLSPQPADRPLARS